MKLQRIIQSLTLLLFVYLLWQTVFPLSSLVVSFIPTDLFLRLDPLVVTLVPLGVKDFVAPLAVGFVVLFLTLLLGRVFCGYVCPMGTSLDFSRHVLPWQFYVSGSLPKNLPQMKMVFLALLAVSALWGVSHIFWASPMALITRFYALLIHPFVLLLGNFGIHILRPLLEGQGISFLAYTQIDPRVFHSVYFIVAFFGMLFALERAFPRFWCRFVCPAGAVLALFSWRPWWRRRVHECMHCGQCVRKCPTAAILPGGDRTKHAECIACQTCVHICPVEAVSFGICEKEPATAQRKGVMASSQGPHMPSRRAFVWATVGGSTLAALGHVNAASFLPSKARASLQQSGFIRAPGTRPEADFLQRCLRCGQCMKACPTNGLQPTWLEGGLEGIFSPVLQARIGGCEPECNVCGQVCPTEAILPLSMEEKRQAKIGTAVVYNELCLAWAEGRSCVVCQEVCPYGAVKVVPHKDSSIPVPIVTARKCYGCGFCEKHCPVRIPAIAVQPLNALRLNTAEYTKAAQAAGLDLVPVALRPTEELPDELPQGTLPPGFSD